MSVLISIPIYISDGKYKKMCATGFTELTFFLLIKVKVATSKVPFYPV